MNVALPSLLLKAPLRPVGVATCAKVMVLSLDRENTETYIRHSTTMGVNDVAGAPQSSGPHARGFVGILG